MTDQPLLCRRCGARLPSRNDWLAAIRRLCAACFDEARRSCPPFVCTAEDIDRGMAEMDGPYRPDLGD